MPSKSQAQHKFMAAAAHSRKFAKAAGIYMKTAKKFMAEDKKINIKKLPKRKKK